MKRALPIFMLTMLLCVPIAQAQMGQEGAAPRDGSRMEGRIKKMFEQLDLSEEQKKLIAANRLKNREAKKTTMEAVKANMKAIGEELRKPELDMTKINSLHEQSKVLFNQMADQKFKSILEVRKILTKEQFVKFTTMLEDRMMNRSFLKETN